MIKNIPKIRLLCSALLGATILAGADLQAQAPNPTDSYTNSFDTLSSRASWLYWYGVNPGNSPITWDSTKDASTNAGSGSLQVVLPFGPSGNQQVMFGTFGNGYGYDGTVKYNGNQFTNISVDVLVDPLTVPNASGNFGALEFSFVTSGYGNGGGPFFTNVVIPGSATNGWIRLTVLVPTGTLGYDDPGVVGFGFKYTSYSGYPTNPITFWMDNITATKSGEPPPPPPPPTMSINKPFQGLNIFAGGIGDYDRENIRTLQTEIGDSYTWLGRGNTPVTYSYTIAGHPGAGHAGFQTHIFLVPAPADNNVSPDYNNANVIFLDMQSQADGSAYCVFRYKTNQPNGNGQYYNPSLAAIGAPTPVGTWSLSFLNDTNVTITTPTGATTNFNISPNVAALFPDPLYVYFGIQPNNEINKGHSISFSNMSIQGSTNTLSDNFLTQSSLDTVNKWSIQAQAAQGVFIMPTNAVYLVNWTAANSAGFNLQATSALGTPWSTNNLPEPLSLGVLKRTILPDTNLPAANKGFFRLIK